MFYEYVTKCRECGWAEAKVAHTSWGRTQEGQHFYLYVLECECGFAFTEQVNLPAHEQAE